MCTCPGAGHTAEGAYDACFNVDIPQDSHRYPGGATRVRDEAGGGVDTSTTCAEISETASTSCPSTGIVQQCASDSSSISAMGGGWGLRDGGDGVRAANVFGGGSRGERSVPSYPSSAKLGSVVKNGAMECVKTAACPAAGLGGGERSGGGGGGGGGSPGAGVPAFIAEVYSCRAASFAHCRWVPSAACPRPSSPPSSTNTGYGTDDGSEDAAPNVDRGIQRQSVVLPGVAHAGSSVRYQRGGGGGGRGFHVRRGKSLSLNPFSPHASSDRDAAAWVAGAQQRYDYGRGGYSNRVDSGRSYSDESDANALPDVLPWWIQAVGVTMVSLVMVVAVAARGRMAAAVRRDTDLVGTLGNVDSSAHGGNVEGDANGGGRGNNVTIGDVGAGDVNGSRVSSFSSTRAQEVLSSMRREWGGFQWLGLGGGGGGGGGDNDGIDAKGAAREARATQKAWEVRNARRARVAAAADRVRAAECAPLLHAGREHRRWQDRVSALPPRPSAAMDTGMPVTLGGASSA